MDTSVQEVEFELDDCNVITKYELGQSGNRRYGTLNIEYHYQHSMVSAEVSLEIAPSGLVTADLIGVGSDTKTRKQIKEYGWGEFEEVVMSIADAIAPLAADSDPESDW